MIFSIAAMEALALPRAQQLSSQLGLALAPVDSQSPQLQVGVNDLAIAIPQFGKPVQIDFRAGKYDHRRKFGGGRGQPLAKAIGLKKGQNPTVIDATAGYARDAFVLASLGCEVTLIEQQPLLCLLINQAIEQALDDADIHDIAKRLSLLPGNAVQLLPQLTQKVDVIYLDPMYPSRDKSALVKKEMQLLHQLIGADMDSAELLKVARTVAQKRVVVKRPKGASFVGEQSPSVSIESKNTRYDIYVC